MKFTCGQVRQTKILLPPSETENLEGGQTPVWGVLSLTCLIATAREKKNHKAVALRKSEAQGDEVWQRNLGLPISYMLTARKSRTLGELSQGKV